MNSTSTQPGGQGLQAIDLTKLNLNQLAQIKQGLDSDLQLYKESLVSLKQAQSRFVASAESVSACQSKDSGREIMLPLSASMYVQGRLDMDESSPLIVDIGTGYYVDMSTTAAKDYFDRKIKYLTENIERVQVIGAEKSKILEMVLEVIQEQQNPASSSRNNSAKK